MRQPASAHDPATLVGRRVVVRYQLHDQDFAATDVIGRLDDWSGGVLRVNPAGDRPPVEIAAADVLVLKAVPPRTVTRREVRDLAAAMLPAQPATTVERLGGWVLRSSGGTGGPANSCLPLDDPGRALSDAVTAVCRWYDERGQAPLFQVPEPLGRSLSAHLDTLGWEPPSGTALVMTAPLAEVPTDWAGLGRATVTTSPAGRRWLVVTTTEPAAEATDPPAARTAEPGTTDVCLEVASTDPAAQAAYERMGFVEHHRHHYRRRPTPLP